MQSEKPKPLTSPSSHYKPVEAYLGLRDLVLRFPAERRAAGGNGIVGALMETGYEQAVASVIMLIDGTTSLYFSSGGGIIGAGQHPPVARSTVAFIKAAEEFVALMRPTTTFPLPTPNHTRFYLLSTNGAWTADENEDELGNNRSALSRLFHLGQDVIAGIRHHSTPGSDK